jgi:hypothetical protein
LQRPRARELQATPLQNARASTEKVSYSDGARRKAGNGLLMVVSGGKAAVATIRGEVQLMLVQVAKGALACNGFGEFKTSCQRSDSTLIRSRE